MITLTMKIFSLFYFALLALSAFAITPKQWEQGGRINDNDGGAPCFLDVSKCNEKGCYFAWGYEGNNEGKLTFGKDLKTAKVTFNESKDCVLKYNVKKDGTSAEVRAENCAGSGMGCGAFLFPDLQIKSVENL